MDVSFTWFVDAPGTPSIPGASDFNRLQGNDLWLYDPPRFSGILRTDPLSCPTGQEITLGWLKNATVSGTWDDIGQVTGQPKGTPTQWLDATQDTHIPYAPAGGLYLVDVNVRFTANNAGGTRRVNIYRQRSSGGSQIGQVWVPACTGNNPTAVSWSKVVPLSGPFQDGIYVTAYQDSGAAGSVETGFGGWNTQLQITYLCGPTG